MKERQILFNAPMARASLDGSKTQTRRVLPTRNTLGRLEYPGRRDKTGHSMVNWLDTPQGIAAAVHECRYGQVGDRLWGRETFFAWGRWETRYSAKKGRDEWHFVDMTVECGESYLYAADGVSDTEAFTKRRGGLTPMFWKRPAIFMPRAASRITLDITDVRVERLQDISEADARAEGARECDPVSGREVLLAGPSQRGSFVLHYRDIWEQINGTGSWKANPWVWVVSFARVGTATPERAPHGQTFG